MKILKPGCWKKHLFDLNNELSTDLNKICSFYSALFGLLGSIFFIKGAIMLSNETIKSMTATKFGGNQELLNNFLTQRTDYTIGGIFIFIAFALQVTPFYYKM